MTLPPFPCQDLAKLVLGYLAEEQLMTAYDEFLQASPYLDALRNEYDRIFMTSLKSILAEYRAVKIYVETCKPFLLRKKLVQCTNLLEVVKLLVNYADINKLQTQDVTSDKVSQTKPNLSTSSKQSFCEVCTTLGLTGCLCRTKQYKCNIQSASDVKTNSLESSVETTALEDLPGNHSSIRKKYARIERQLLTESNSSTSENNILPTTYITGTNELNCNSQNIQRNENSSHHLTNIAKGTDSPECREKIEEFNNILNKVCKNKSNADIRSHPILQSVNMDSKITNTSFEDFASGVNCNENINVPVPDSSTSANSNTQCYVNDKQISHSPNELRRSTNEHSAIQPNNSYTYSRIKSKSDDQKIKIISDIKVGNQYSALSNATSTPLMQSIIINGTPAYKHKLPVVNNNYTKDEIMAMPTIIVVPTSGPPQKCTQTQPVLSKKKKKVKTKTVSSTKILEPLVIDISSNTVPINNNVDKSGLNLQNPGIVSGLIKTVDITKNASVPKDNIISGSTHTTTPQQALPPVRKSSSTPRRNSHIRVLDFTTPRRILHETNEKIPEETYKSLEINEKSLVINETSLRGAVTESHHLLIPSTTNCDKNVIDMNSVTMHKIESCPISKLTKENTITKPVYSKKPNWDTDLRALAIASENSPKVVVKKPKIRYNKKKQDKSEKSSTNNKDSNISSKDSNNTPDTEKSRSKRKKSPKGKKSKRRKLEEEEEQYNKTIKDTETKATLKPTFNIVAADSRNSQENRKFTDSQNKSNSDGTDETPESERLSLQNEIGTKLNISDLLETPYKQALYDIQMETPKFLGSMLSEESISDIKIMNIPTPRFFDTPKPVQNTPYTSRGTDYSSGGSYYKPDEQDYLKIPDLECPVISSKEDPKPVLSKEIEYDTKKSTRPVRKCTKNVSYKASASKLKDTDSKDIAETASTCSYSSMNSSFENSKENLKIPKKVNKGKLQFKSDTKKRHESDKKRKSPLKRDKSNTFMKIKPRRPTPIKENNQLNRKKIIGAQNNSLSQSKKRISGKEKSVQKVPVVASASTKSRRKSSTPRKLHCSKQFNSESSVSPDMKVAHVQINITQAQALPTHDSDSEQLVLQWSDDCLQDGKPRVSECEDISKIKEYIESSVQNKTDYIDGKGALQKDLIKRGFDVETAKIIERDLLDTPTELEHSQESKANVTETRGNECHVKKVTNHDSDDPNDTEMQQDLEDDIELSVYECDEESDNFITYTSEAKDLQNVSPVTLKESWTMEVCIEDGLPIRLRATNFKIMYDNVPQDVGTGYSFKETEVAVSSISNLDNLFTPRKDDRSQCYDIFDSTLTSIDTPLKLESPKDHETTQIEVVVEEEIEEIHEKCDLKKRKRLQGSNSSEESTNENKKTKPEAQYLFNSTSIQNIDIESVLKKLHGP